MAKIMIVDDNADLLGSMIEPLESCGHHVTTAENGACAMKLVGSALFDLVITDLVMPEKEGLETIQELRKHHPSIQIIAMSGSMGKHRECMLRMANFFGAVQTLDKPFSVKQLLAAVNSALQKVGAGARPSASARDSRSG